MRLMSCLKAAAVAALLSTGVASAQTLDIAGTYGNELGCKVAKGQAQPAEEALLVKPDRFEASGSACDFVQVIKAKDGTSVVTALCDLEGEEGRSVSLFSIAKSKSDPNSLVIRDEYGASWDEVKPCQ